MTVECPECGEPLTAEIRTEGKHIVVLIGCDGDGDDEFTFEISTGLTEDDLADYPVGKSVKMTGKITTRESDPEAKDNPDD